MLKKENGFTLIELLIVMVIFAIVLLLTANTFKIILRSTAQQSKISETQIESTVGLELLRTDIEHSGYGLPWVFQNTIAYNEAASAPESAYNDSPDNPPRAILSGNNTETNGSDYLVIKSTVAGGSNTSQRWSYITGATPTTPKTWNSEDIDSNARVVVIKPKAGEDTFRQLRMNGGTFFTTYSSTAFDTNFSPSQATELFIIYGVDLNSDLRMPFNRADYYISTSNVPSDCAPNTGVLMKGIINNSTAGGGGNIGQYLPLLDCVADFQVVFGLDTNSDGIRDSTSELVALPTTAQGIREQVKDVTVSILSHEGKKDTDFSYSNSTINVGPNPFDLSATIITDWQRYRWKVYTLTIRPKNML